MFFYLSKIITFLIDPLFAILVLLLVFIIRGTRRAGSRIIFLGVFAVLYLASTSAVSSRLLFHLEHLVAPSPLAARYDAVIVLSGMTGIQNPDNNRVEFSDAVDRILAGIQLVREGKTDRLILSGGDGSLTQRNRPEAELLREFAIQNGISPKKIFIDTTSRNTYENAVRTSEMVKGLDVKKMLLITSAFHMYRSRGCFQRAGLTVDVLPVDYMAETVVADFRGFLPSSSALGSTSRVIHEVVGIIVYGITGRAVYSLSP